MSTANFSISSNRGRRLLPALIDEIAVNDPARVVFSYPLTPSLEDGFRDVTFKEFANAINRCSWLLKEKLGHCDTFKTLTYMGPSDQRYIILIFAAIKTGYKLFLSSPSNSMEAHLKLLEDLACDVILTPANKLPLVENILSAKPMTALTIPSLDDLLTRDEVPAYPYDKEIDQARYEPFVVLHTSGSTGLPKPVIMNHGTMTHHDLFLETPRLGGKEIGVTRFSGGRLFFGLPMFHSAGICFLVYSIYSGTIPVFSTSFLPTAEAVNKAHLHARVDGSFLVPNILTEITRNPEYLENIRRLKYLTFGGATLPREIGNILKDYAHLFVSFGATETGFYALEAIDSVDWEYVSFSPFMGYELRPFSEDLFEFVFVRQESLRDFQGVFSTFPTIEEYAPKDLYSKHPSKEGLWLYQGRSDDIVVTSTTLKLNPSSMEGILNAHPLISSALICGSGRPHFVLLIEGKSPPRTEDERSRLLTEIWPAVQRANLTAPSHAHIDKELVIFTSPEKPMARAGKGSVQRKMTEQLYNSELDQIYKG